MGRVGAGAEVAQPVGGGFLLSPALPELDQPAPPQSLARLRHRVVLHAGIDRQAAVADVDKAVRPFAALGALVEKVHQRVPQEPLGGVEVFVRRVFHEAGMLPYIVHIRHCVSS